MAARVLGCSGACYYFKRKKELLIFLTSSKHPSTRGAGGAIVGGGRDHKASCLGRCKRVTAISWDLSRVLGPCIFRVAVPGEGATAPQDATRRSGKGLSRAPARRPPCRRLSIRFSWRKRDRCLYETSPGGGALGCHMGHPMAPQGAGRGVRGPSVQRRAGGMTPLRGQDSSRRPWCLLLERLARCSTGRCSSPQNEGIVPTRY